MIRYLKFLLFFPLPLLGGFWERNANEVYRPELINLRVLDCSEGDLESDYVSLTATVLKRTTAEIKGDSIKISNWTTEKNGSSEKLSLWDPKPLRCRKYLKTSEIVVIRGATGPTGPLCGNDERLSRPNPSFSVVRPIPPEMGAKIFPATGEGIPFPKDGVYRLAERSSKEQLKAIRGLDHQIHLIEEPPIRVHSVNYHDAYGKMFIEFTISPIPRTSASLPIVCLKRLCHEFYTGGGGDRSTLTTVALKGDIELARSLQEAFGHK